jgi:hypothetical protein
MSDGKISRNGLQPPVWALLLNAPHFIFTLRKLILLYAATIPGPISQAYNLPVPSARGSHSTPSLRPGQLVTAACQIVDHAVGRRRENRVEGFWRSRARGRNRFPSVGGRVITVQVVQRACQSRDKRARCSRMGASAISSPWEATLIPYTSYGQRDSNAGLHSV